MVKFFSALFFICCLSEAVYSQDSLCLKNMRTGTFTYEGQEGRVEIIRTRKKQVENYNGGKSKIILRIKWVNDSTYVLTFRRAKNAPGCLKEGDTITTRILECDGNSYYCEYSSRRCGGGRITFVKLD
jgi:hypothetical protein